MADNVVVTAGTGTTVAADEVVDGTLGTVKVQYVKIMDGTLDSSTKAAVGANGLKVDGSAVTQPVSLATNTPTLQSGSTTAVTQATGTNLHTVVDSGTITASNVTGNVASAAADSGNPVKTGGVYNSSNITLTNGQRGDDQLDVNGFARVTLATKLSGEDQTNTLFSQLMKPVASSTYSPSTYQQSGSVTKANIKASTGNVYAVRITNGNAAVRYLQLHNKATAPAAADTAQLYYVIPAGTGTAPGVLELTSTHFAPSEYFATGIGWAISTTATTFTDSATAGDHNTTVRYV